MRRREFLGIAGSVLAWPAAAQNRDLKPMRMGFLSSYSEVEGKHLVGCFTAALGQLGWVQGKNLTIDYRWIEGQPQNNARFAAELVGLGPDIIAVNSTPATQAVRAATARSGTPVVFMSVSDPVASGIVQSFARPGANVTGVSNFFPAYSAKLLETIIAVVPKASRIVVVRDPANPGKTLDLRAIEEAGSAIGVTVVEAAVKNSSDIARLFSQWASLRADALIVLIDGVTLTNRALILDLVGRLSLPAIYQVRDFVDAGGLISYGLNFCKHFARAAAHADKILRGVKPSDLPVELPTTFELVINLKTAKRLALEIPTALLVRADEVIE